VPRSIPGYYAELPSENGRKLSKADREGFASPIGKVLEDPARTDLTVTDILRTYAAFPDGEIAGNPHPSPIGGLAQFLVQMLLTAVYGVTYFAFPLAAFAVVYRWLGVALSPNRLALLQAALREGDEPISTRLFSVAWVLLPVALLIANDAGQLPLPAFAIGYLCLVSLANFRALGNYVIDKTEAIQQPRPAWDAADQRSAVLVPGVPEKVLVLDSLIGGWLGALAAQQLLHHKANDAESVFRANCRAAFAAHLLVVAALAAAAIWSTADRSKLRSREEPDRVRSCYQIGGPMDERSLPSVLGPPNTTARGGISP
jgi:uncharacterized membrane protein YsdA (DUF1294 family)